MPSKPKSIDEFLSRVSPDKRAALEGLRSVIRSAAPQAEECISYGLAAFRQDGMLVGFGATATQCAFYLMSSSTVKTFKDDLEGYDTSTGTIRFPAAKPLPAALVRKLVRARLAENQRLRGAKPPASKTKKPNAAAKKTAPTRKRRRERPV